MSDPDSILLVLSKLNPRLQNWEEFDPAPFITESDVAHALGLCQIYESALLGRVKWARQEEYMNELVNYLSLRFLDNNREYRTPKSWIGKDPIRKLCKMALDEFSGSQLCGECRGKGSVKIEALIVDCIECEGHGVISHKDNRPWKFGVTEKEWGKWERLYGSILKDLDHLENYLTGSLRRTMRVRLTA